MQSQAAHRAAQEQGAGVAHKRLGRMEIVGEEGSQAAQQSRREQGQVHSPRRNGNNGEKCHHRNGDAGGQAVDAVGEIHRIDAPTMTNMANTMYTMGWT